MNQYRNGNNSTKKAGRRAVVAVLVLIIVVAILVLFAPDELYSWIKAIHVISVISWMAGMLYLPRLFVYHVDCPYGSVQSDTFCIMEQRLLRIIINPAMTATWITGLWLAWTGFEFQANWLYAKFLLVVAMSALHGHYSAAVRRFADGSNTRSQRFWRIANEVPVALMIGIVILVIVKPF